MANVTTSVFLDLIGRDRGASKTVKDVGQSADKAGKAADKAGAKFTRMGKDAKKAGSEGKGLGDKMSGGLEKVGSSALGLVPQIAAVTIGIQSLGEAWDATLGAAMRAEAGADKLAGRLGLTERAAAKSARVAKTIFGEAWGESLDDVNLTIEALGTNLVDIEKVSRRELTKMTRSAQILADTWDVEVGEAARAAGQLVRTGLAKDYQQAFDLIVRGFQEGGNRADDLLDTINEYSTQFRKLGISGPYAMSLISAAMKAGARDSDIAADAIKEFSIRAIDGSEATAQGFKLAGLNADTMSDRIAKGGKTAERAFRQTLRAIMSIEDPVKRDAAGVALLGTQWEDLGPQVVEAMAKAKPGVDGLRGATERLGDTVGTNVAASFEALRRKAGGWFAKIGEAGLPLLQRLADKIDKVVVPAVTRWVDWFSGPGKYRIAEAFLGMTESGIQFGSDFLRVLRKVSRETLKWAGRTLDAFTIALGWNPKWHKGLADANRDFDRFSAGVDKELGDAIGDVDDWGRSVSKMKKEVRLRGNIEDLNRKLATARKKLRDKELTRERRARLNADISRLLSRKAAAQRAINSLRGKTVYLDVHRRTFYEGGDPVHGRNYSGRRASGGPVMAGRTYLVGEQGPELVTFGQHGRVHSNADSKRMVSGGGGGQPVVLDVRGGDSDLIRLIRKWIRTGQLQGVTP